MKNGQKGDLRLHSPRRENSDDIAKAELNPVSLGINHKFFTHNTKYFIFPESIGFSVPMG
jgi:hypothetical protein